MRNYKPTPFDSLYVPIIEDAVPSDKVEEAVMLHELAGEFAQQEIAPIARKIHEEHAYPHALWQKLGATGLKGVIIPEEYGGGGLGYAQFAIAIKQLSKESGSVALSVIADQGLGAHQIIRFGSEAQKLKFLPGLADGSLIASLAMSDEGRQDNVGASDVVAMDLYAERDGDDFILNGTKYWITNAARVDEKGDVVLADVCVAYAITSEEPLMATAFLLEPGMPGYTAVGKIRKDGMTASETWELKFENCRVPKENILGEVGKGFPILMSGLNGERLILAAGALGLAEAAWEDSLKHLSRRSTFGMPVIFNQAVAHPSSEYASELMAAYDHLYGVARRADKSVKTLASHTGNAQAASAFLRASTLATEMTVANVKNHGGSGIVPDTRAPRLLMDALLYTNGGGSEAMRLRRISELTIPDYRKHLKLGEAVRVALGDALGVKPKDLERSDYDIAGMLSRGELRIEMGAPAATTRELT